MTPLPAAPAAPAAPARCAISLAFVLALLFSTPLAAAVSFTCTVSVSGISFGIYSPLNAGGDAATGSYLVTCTALGSGSATVAGTMSLSTGSSGRFATRTMTSGINVLDYNIYLTPAYAQILGDGTQGTYQLSASGTVTAGQNYQVGGALYGFVPSGQDVAPGAYADTIVVTVAY